MDLIITDVLYWVVLAAAGAGGIYYLVASKKPSVPKTPKADVSLAQPLDSYQKGLSKSRLALGEQLKAIFGRPTLGIEEINRLEEALISADVGARLTIEIIQELKKSYSTNTPLDAHLISILKKHLRTSPPQIPQGAPHVILFVGVNGAGKTTTIGKLAHHLRDKKVIVVAGDTFRAAATEQLQEWAVRSGATLVRKDDADPSSVIFDGCKQALESKADFVLIDTAGRLQTKVPLMDELKKITRTIQKVIPSAPHEAYLVLDANTGQNGLSQAKLFHEAVGLTGVVLTKLDGTSKGGIAYAIGYELGIPVTWVGLGESLEDLQQIDAEKYTANLISYS